MLGVPGEFVQRVRWAPACVSPRRQRGLKTSTDEAPHRKKKERQSEACCFYALSGQALDFSRPVFTFDPQMIPD